MQRKGLNVAVREGFESSALEYRRGRPYEPQGSQAISAYRRPLILFPRCSQPLCGITRSTRPMTAFQYFGEGIGEKVTTVTGNTKNRRNACGTKHAPVFDKGNIEVT